MNRGKALQALLSLVLAAGCAHATQPHASSLANGRYEQSLEFGGLTRTFILRIPNSVDLTKPAPLVVVLHGWTTSARLAELYTMMAEQAEKSGFIVAFPDGLGSMQGWNAGFIDLSGKKADDVGFISAVLDKIESEANVDPDRVYVAGHSNGAFMANEVGAKLGDRLAAIGVVAGTIGIPSSSGSGYTTIDNPSAPISVIAIHSRLDTMVAYDDSDQALLRDVSAPDSAKWWAEKDGCNMNPGTVKNSAGTIATTTYTGGKNGTEVTLVTLEHGSHNWPGGLTRSGKETASGLDAAQTLWDFFASHPRQKKGPVLRQ